jgi:hypothetical protein
MFNSTFPSLTNLRGYNAPMMPKATQRFAGICRIDWRVKRNTGNEHEGFRFSVISSINIDSPKHPQLDNC